MGFWLADSGLWTVLHHGWTVLVHNFDTLVLEPLRYPLLARSMEAAIIVGIVSGVLGTYVVVRGMAFFGDALAHAILPGVAFAYQTVLAWGMALLVHQGGRLVGLGG